MNKSVGKILLVAGVLMIWPATALGAQFLVADNDNDAVATSDNVGDDLFMAGNVVTIEHEVADDVWAAGSKVEVKGSVGQDVIAVGQTVSVMAPVGDDIMVAGEIVRIQAGSVGDIMAAGQTVEIFDTVVSGSAYLAGQQVTLSGQVEGNVRVAAESVTIKSGTTINGDLITYGNEQQPVIEAGVTIGGQQVHHVSQLGQDRRGIDEVWEWVRSVMAWFLLGLVLLYGVPTWTRAVIRQAVKRSGQSLLWGFLALLLFIPVIILLLISLVGWPIALGGGVLLIGLMVMAGGFGGLIVGNWIMAKYTKDAARQATWQDALLGVVVVRAVGLIPGIGALVVIVIFVLAFGAQLVILKKVLRDSAS